MQQHLLASRPIGIFDSGIGGLHIAQALLQLLPQENMVYFGDTAHMPYGQKSAQAIQSYAIKITEILLQQNCKLILIACNAASASAYDTVRHYVGSRAHVVNVIDPVVDYLQANSQNKVLGLIGTTRTIESNVYQQKISESSREIYLRPHATPLLASAIEEHYPQFSLIEGVLTEYLSHTILKDIDALLLACTHYPIIKEQIAAFYQNNVTIIDTSAIVATAVATYLELRQLKNHINNEPKRTFYVSDYTENFAAAAELFFRQPISLQRK